MSMLDVQKPNLSPTSHLSPTSPTMRKRQRTLDHVGNAAPADGHAMPLSGPAAVGDDAFITDHDAVESGVDEDDDDDGVTKPKDKKAGRRKIKIEYIQDKSRRHITFSKRKAGMLFHKLLATHPSHMPIYRHYEKGNIYSRFVHPLLSHLSP
jgi:pheromone receptor transcription factor